MPVTWRDSSEGEVQHRAGNVAGLAGMAKGYLGTGNSTLFVLIAAAAKRILEHEHIEIPGIKECDCPLAGPD